MVPREALIRTGYRTAVVLALGDGRFQPVEVVPGEESGDWIEIQQGIKEGDLVVVSGQFLIDSEASVRASFSRMQSSKPAPGETKTPASGAHTER
jgi:Cu(I)/Ag(I) efflux system membrane fusion protein